MKGLSSLRRIKGSHASGGHEGEPSGERWLLTYADMITLLLVLFIVLFAISTVDQAKYQEFKQSVSKAVLSHIPHGTTDSVATTTASKTSAAASQVSASKANATPAQMNQLAQIELRLKAVLGSKALLSDVNISMNSSGLVLGLVTDSTFFDSDSAGLTTVGQRIVDTATGVLTVYPNAIEVAGYTDNEPITGGPYATNWALSAARATTVVLRMTKKDGLNPTRIALIGYGQYHPLVPNTSATAQARNRRVDIIVSPTGNFTP